ncbi:cytidylate kinase family protein [Patescibacteria group bacterium]|nr:cytidylate kinase family protein [Patescibacteria group bacterium]
MGTYLDYLKKYQKTNKQSKKLTITVSGQAGSGKNTIAEHIADVFKLKFVNAGDIQRQYAQKMNISLDKASKVLPADIDHFMDKKTLELATKGGYVLVGRLAAWVAGDFAKYRIFVDCSQQVRIKRVSKRENITQEQARERIIRRDKRDKNRYKRLYKIDLDEKNIYNVIIKNNEPGINKLKQKIINKINK